MATTSARTLRLLSLLQEHRFWTGDELADRLGVSARTLRRDVDRLRELGYPVHATRGAGGGYQLERGARLPPLVVDDDEAVALAVALHGAALSGVADVAEPALRALTKVVPMLPPGLRGSMEALRSMVVTQPPASGSGVGVAPEILAVVAQACRDGVRLRFGYTTNDGTSGERTTDPLRLVTLGRRWYLVAFDLDRDGWRTFRLDRMADPQPSRNTVPARTPPGDDLAAYVRDGVAASRSTQEVVVVVDAPTAEVAARVGRWGVVSDAGEGRTRIVMEPDGFEWPILLLAAIDAPVHVEKPASFLESLHRLGGWFTGASQVSE